MSPNAIATSRNSAGSSSTAMSRPPRVEAGRRPPIAVGLLPIVAAFPPIRWSAMVWTSSASGSAAIATGTSGSPSASRPADAAMSRTTVKSAPPRRGDDRLGEGRREIAVAAGAILCHGKEAGGLGAAADREHGGELLRTRLEGVEREADEHDAVGHRRGRRRDGRPPRCPGASTRRAAGHRRRTADEHAQLAGAHGHDRPWRTGLQAAVGSAGRRRRKAHRRRVRASAARPVVGERCCRR